MQDNNQQFNDFSQNQNFTNVPQQQFPQQSMPKQKKPVYKKWWFWVIIVVVVIVLISSLSGSDSDSKSTTEPNSISSQSASNENDKSSDVQAEENGNENNNTVGDYKCVVKKAVLCKDYAKKDAVLITYEFTNNSKESVSFDVALKDDVYQDGIALETAILEDDTDLLDVKIKPGVTKEVKKAYKLRDTKTSLDVEISELISFSDDKIITKVKLQK